MAAVLVLNEIQGATGGKHVTQGSNLSRVAHVIQMPGPYADDAAQINAAFAVLIAVTGDVGTQVTIGGGTAFVESIHPEIVDTQKVKFTITYKGYPITQISFGTSMVSVETNKDKDGATHYVSHAPPDQRCVDNNWPPGTTHSQGVTFQAELAEFTITTKFTITATAPTDAVLGITTPGGSAALDRIVLFAKAFVGGVNAAVIASGSIAGAARTWRLEVLQADSRDGGGTFEAQVTYHYRSDTWDILATWLYPDTGKPPSGLVTAPSGWTGPTTGLFPDWLTYGTEYLMVRKYKEVTFPVLPGLT